MDYDGRVLTYPLPSLKETAIGLYVERRAELKLDHALSCSRTVEELILLYPGLTPLQANLAVIDAVREARASTSDHPSV